MGSYGLKAKNLYQTDNLTTSFILCLNKSILKGASSSHNLLKMSFTLPLLHTHHPFQRELFQKNIMSSHTIGQVTKMYNNVLQVLLSF